jgi:hypothetical protein
MKGFGIRKDKTVRLDAHGALKLRQPDKHTDCDAAVLAPRRDGITPLCTGTARTFPASIDFINVSLSFFD